MGNIEKEKLLKELNKEIDGFGKIDVIKVQTVIKNFPEEPEIDFDALYEEYSVSVKFYNTPSAWGFRDFLKSKNLTVPKPVEIPVKRTWTLKKHVGEIFHDFGNSPYPFTSDPPENLKKYYDLHEEPDYSKIPNGSIVEVTGKINTNNRIVDYFKKHENGFLFLGFTTVKADLFNIRIVELAKE